MDRFRAYDSPADSFRDYARLIRGGQRYEDALNTGSNVAGFATALQDGGYATDPNYARKITAVAREVKSVIAAEQFKSAADGSLTSHAGVRS